MFCSNLYYFDGQFGSTTKNLIAKQFNMCSIWYRLSFLNDWNGHVFLPENYFMYLRLYFNIQEGCNSCYICLLLERLDSHAFSAADEITIPPPPFVRRVHNYDCLRSPCVIWEIWKMEDCGRLNVLNFELRLVLKVFSEDKENHDQLSEFITAQ